MGSCFSILLYLRLLNRLPFTVRFLAFCLFSFAVFSQSWCFHPLLFRHACRCPYRANTPARLCSFRFLQWRNCSYCHLLCNGAFVHALCGIDSDIYAHWLAGLCHHWTRRNWGTSINLHRGGSCNADPQTARNKRSFAIIKCIECIDAKA